MTDPLDHPDALSPAGAARRDAMLGALRAEVPRAAAARRNRRRAVRAAALIILVGVVGVLALPRRTSVPPPPAHVEAPAPPPGWTLVRTDDTAASRLTVHSRADWSGVIVNDDELLLELEEMGRPAGIIRTGGKTYISGLDTSPAGS